nr:integrase, catalytic region, zinc finger, CCHC-type, peptidase aspartic, catalytic [Tanacetum cinerariifolium]
IEVDDQAIQTILLGLPEDIYAAVIQNTTQNPRVQNGLIGVQGNGNQNQIGNGNLMAARAEGNAAGTIVTLQRVVKHIMTIETYNWLSSTHQELHKIEAAKFVGDFKSLANEADASLAKHKILELEIERLLKAVVSQDIMNIMQKESVIDTSDLQTELECMKERFENCIIKKENEYAKLWNDWIELLQAQLGDLKGKCKDTSCVSDTQNLLSQKLENENVELEFQVLNYARENVHLKATYKNLFESIYVLRTQTKTITASLQNELQSTTYKNAKLRTQLFKKVSDQKDNTHDTSKNTKFAKQPIVENLPKKQMAKVSVKDNQKKYQQKVTKQKQVGILERLATPKPKKPRFLLRWSPTGRLFDKEGNIVDSSKSGSQSDCSKCDNTCTSNTMEPKIKLFSNSTSLLDRVYFIEGLGYNLISVGQFCDSDLEAAFRRNTCVVINLEEVDLLKGNRITNLYTINLYKVAFASLICLMTCVTSIKSWLWHQRLSHLNFETINDLARNDLVTGLP